MMDLDRSPELFSPQNELYLLCSYFFQLFQLVTPGVASVLTQGQKKKKKDKGPQRDATYQISKLPYSFRKEEF